MNIEMPKHKKVPTPCVKCGAPVTEILPETCEVCSMILYLEFRFEANWPLDEADKKRLGLA